MGQLEALSRAPLTGTDTLLRYVLHTDLMHLQFLEGGKHKCARDDPPGLREKRGGTEKRPDPAYKNDLSTSVIFQGKLIAFQERQTLIVIISFPEMDMI